MAFLERKKICLLEENLPTLHRALILRSKEILPGHSESLRNGLCLIVKLPPREDELSPCVERLSFIWTVSASAQKTFLESGPKLGMSGIQRKDTVLVLRELESSG